MKWDSESLTIGSTRFPALWLRDQCPADRDPGTGQRLVDIADLPERPEIQDVVCVEDSVTIHWIGESQPCVLSLAWLQSTQQSRGKESQLWTAGESGRFQWTAYAEVQRDDRRRMQWLAALIRDGLAFLTDVPAVEGEVEQAARLCGYITETNYGRIFDVRAMASPNNLAYTPLSLGVHTDNPYRDPVPGYQLLHCLTPSVEGGESIFVDGFAVAAELRRRDPAAFRTLTNTPAGFAFRDAGTCLQTSRPLIQLDDRGELGAVHYNNRSMSTARVPLARAAEFFQAYRVWARLLRSPEFEWRVLLKAGELIAFDNHRVLHGRTAFIGSRLLQGCYVGRDGVAANLASLRNRL
jgi:gamma-butyrobetaine dioxygenase